MFNLPKRIGQLYKFILTVVKKKPVITIIDHTYIAELASVSSLIVFDIFGLH